MIEIKKGTIFKALRPEIYNTFSVLDSIFARYSLNAVITSGNDGEHMPLSLHYLDLAYDFRSNHLPSDEAKRGIRDLLIHSLGQHYDILLEFQGLPNEHFHLEYDPNLYRIQS